MADYGIKISLPGKDISSSTPEDYVFSSKFSSVKIVQQSVNRTYETVTVNAGSLSTVTINHALGFIPLVMVFWEANPSSGRWYNGVAYPSPLDFPVATYLNNIENGTRIDTSNVYLVFYNQSGGNQTIKYYYYIFGDDGI